MTLAEYVDQRRDRSAGDDACWPWLLSTGSHGYGQGFWEGKSCLAHRLAWIAEHGPIPDGLTVDHLCRVQVCVNPGHLRLLTNVENARRNGMSVRTHCPQKHAYDEENTYMDPKGHRRCRRCAVDRRVAA